MARQVVSQLYQKNYFRFSIFFVVFHRILYRLLCFHHACCYCIAGSHELLKLIDFTIKRCLIGFLKVLIELMHVFNVLIFRNKSVKSLK